MCWYAIAFHLYFHDNQLNICESQRERKYPAAKLSTGCPLLNQFLKGGIPQQGITEIAGESASGKTQLSLQLSLTVQKPVTEGGLNGGKNSTKWHLMKFI